MTALVHGEEAADKARVASEALFGRGPDAGPDDQALEVIAQSSDIPAVAVARAAFDGGLPLADVLVRAGRAPSKADARRGLQAGGYYVNGEQVSEPNHMFTPDDFAGRDWVLLRKGKKNYVKLVAE